MVSRKNKLLPVAGSQQQQQFGRKQLGGSPKLRNQTRLGSCRPSAAESVSPSCISCSSSDLSIILKKELFFSPLPCFFRQHSWPLHQRAHRLVENGCCAVVSTLAPPSSLSAPAVRRADKPLANVDKLGLFSPVQVGQNFFTFYILYVYTI